MWQNGRMSDTVQIELLPLGTRIEVARGSAFADVLAAYGVEFPCGGCDLCGGCRVRVVEGMLPALIEDQYVFSENELAQGWRLACRARVETSLKLEIGQWITPVLVDATQLAGGFRTGFGIAIDVGTTTIAAQLLDLASGEVLAVRTALNPQCAHGADVMSRVLFAMSNPALTPMIRDAIGGMVTGLAGNRSAEISEIVLVGNTVMHHLFAGIDVEPLSHAPFVPGDAGEQSSRRSSSAGACRLPAGSNSCAAWADSSAPTSSRASALSILPAPTVCASSSISAPMVKSF